MEDNTTGNTIRLNKYLAHCGICSRREAIDLIKKGFVIVNGEAIKDPFFELDTTESVTYKGKLIKPIVKKEYILLNKPANIPFGANPIPGKPNVAGLLSKLTQEEVYPAFPVSDDNCGLVIMTNDDELKERLSDEKKNVKILFEVFTNGKVSPDDMSVLLAKARKTFEQLVGIEIIEEGTPAKLGAELKGGNGVMLRKWLEEAGLKVIKIDLTSYGSLTKKDLKRGWSRVLTDRELIFLRHF